VSTAKFFQQLDEADLHPRQGHHKQYSGPELEWENGELVEVGEFDYDEIDRRLGNKPETEQHDKDIDRAADMLGHLVYWFSTSETINSAGLRAFALSFSLRPDLFSEKTMAELARRLGVTKQALTKRASELFHPSNGIFVGRHMYAPSVRKKRQKISLEYHRRVGHKIHDKKPDQSES
jgi:hypothetical protein